MPVATNIHPSFLTWLGLSHESAYGTPALVGGSTPVGPVLTLPLDASTFQPEDKPVWLKDMAIRGSMADVYAIVQGVEDASWSLGGPVYPGITPALLDNMFGDIATTATGGTFSGSTTLNGAYTRNSSGTSITVTAPGTIAAGTVIKITNVVPGTLYSEYVQVASITGSVVTLVNPLHYSYNTLSTISYAVAAALPTSYSHKFAALNAYDGQPPPYTALDSTGVTDTLSGSPQYMDQFGQRYYTSLCMAQLDFTISAEALFTQKASGTSWASQATSDPTADGGLATPATSAFTPSTVTTQPIPSWSSSISLALPDVNSGAAAVVNYVGEVTFSLKRKLQVYWTNDGVQTPYIIARGPLGVTGTVKGVVANDEQMLKSMRKNFQGVLSATVTAPTSDYPVVEGNNSFTFHVTNAAFTAAKPTRSSVLVGYDCTFEGVANTTDVGQSGGLGPITVTAVDTTPGY